MIVVDACTRECLAPVAEASGFGRRDRSGPWKQGWPVQAQEDPIFRNSLVARIGGALQGVSTVFVHNPWANMVTMINVA